MVVTSCTVFDEAGPDSFCQACMSGFDRFRRLVLELRIHDFVKSIKGRCAGVTSIDIAHGHADSVIQFNTSKNCQIPLSLLEMLEHLKLSVNWKMRGADATKVGIGPGKVCITKVKTGFGTGGCGGCSSLVLKAARKPIIADGGIRTHGDIAKSVASGHHGHDRFSLCRTY